MENRDNLTHRNPAVITKEEAAKRIGYLSEQEFVVQFVLNRAKAIGENTVYPAAIVADAQGAWRQLEIHYKESYNGQGTVKSSKHTKRKVQ